MLCYTVILCCAVLCCAVVLFHVKQNIGIKSNSIYPIIKSIDSWDILDYKYTVN